MSNRSGKSASVSTWYFYLGIGALAVVLVVAGFTPTYISPLLTGTLEKDTIVHVHAVAYVGWIGVFVVQAGLASFGRFSAHRKLGRAGVVYAALLVVFGLMTTFNQLANGVAEGKAEGAQRFLLIPLVDMFIFPLLIAAAVAYRKRREMHSRLMLIATTYILIAPAARVDLKAFMALDISFFAIWLSPLFVAMVYDLATRRRVHWVYLAGIALMVGSMARVPFSETDTWLAIARGLSTLVT